MDDHLFKLNLELSNEERDTLQQMMGELQHNQHHDRFETETFQQQIDALNKRMNYLTNMCITIDRSIKTLHEVIRLNIEKSEILNQRIDTIIESIRSGEPL